MIYWCSIFILRVYLQKNKFTAIAYNWVTITFENV